MKKQKSCRILEIIGLETRDDDDVDSDQAMSSSSCFIWFNVKIWFGLFVKIHINNTPHDNNWLTNWWDWICLVEGWCVTCICLNLGIFLSIFYTLFYMVDCSYFFSECRSVDRIILNSVSLVLYFSFVFLIFGIFEVCFVRFHMTPNYLILTTWTDWIEFERIKIN